MLFGPRQTTLAAFALFAMAFPRAAAAQQTPPAQIPPTLPGPITVPPPPPVLPYVPFPQVPVLTPLDEANNGIGLAQQTARANKLQGRVLWIDATANLDRVNTAEKIAVLVAQIKTAGFNTIVFEVKPIVGLTVYPSKFAPKLTEWRKPGFPVRTLPADFDPLAAFVQETRKQGVGLVANLNVFSEGHRDFQIGPGYQNPAWQTTLYEPAILVRGPVAGSANFPVANAANRPARNGSELAVYTDLNKLKPDPAALVAVLGADEKVAALIDGASFVSLAPNLPPGGSALVGTGQAAQFLRQSIPVGQGLVVQTAPVYVSISERPEQQVPLMTNPHNPDVRQRVLDMVREVVTNYQVDGVIFDDRLRYANVAADFSEATRREFEQWLATGATPPAKPLTWPDDVFRWEVAFPALTRTVVAGPYFDDWLLFRTLTIRNFVASAVGVVKSVRPTATLSVYAGSWYGEYPTYGANWAADDFEAGFRFLTPSYQKTGFAGLLDWLTTGCYYSTATVAEAGRTSRAPGATVEAAGQLSNRAANDQTWVYAGISLADFANKPDQLKQVLQAAAASTQGIMVFDLSHNIEPFWPVFADVFREPAVAPHARPDLLSQVRTGHAAKKAAGEKQPPVVIYAGAAGAGF